MTAPQPPIGSPGPSGVPGGPGGPLPGTPGAPGPVGTRPPAPASGRGRGKTIGWSLAAALLIFVTVLLVLFVVFNTQTVDISLVFGNIEAPLVLALVIAAALGGLVVALAGIALRARRAKKP
ncbi:lipopolysaccharide assembly protein LapA domain-containing protein [Geodermatophilus sp. SYSU D00691]